MGLRWDIFCTVVDNLGDIGVSWRLSRALATGGRRSVRLWIDAPQAFARIRPGADPARDAQTVDGVEVRRWATPFPAVEPGDVVIEMFQCELPETFVGAMAARVVKPRWVNLDYLSAEEWVKGCHRLPSPHPRLPLTKHFFFPGFEAGTGGLILEDGLLEARDAFLADRRAISGFWHGLDLPPRVPGELRVSLFCYPRAPAVALFDAWSRGAANVTCLVPDGPVADALVQAFGGDLADGWIERGNARFRVIPFTGQDRYDRLLWACDVNFVRGEDSFVRAQWAQHPFVWHIYPQGENAHWIKLNAFLDRFCADYDPDAAVAMRDLWRAWNGIARPDALSGAWARFIAHRARFDVRAAQWAGRLAALGGLAGQLAGFCEEPL
jgi:uncharacterized repeat protein (TIGR03837 family)